MEHDPRRPVPPSAHEPRAEESPQVDPALQEALLSVFRHVELSLQLQELLRRAAGWAGAAAGWAFVPDPEAPPKLTLAGTYPADPPPPEHVPEFTAEVLRGWAPGEERIYPGLGPPESPGAVLALGVGPERGDAVALLFLSTASPPGEAGRSRARSLVSLAAPAVTNALQLRAIRELVIQDDTADCFNRRHFNAFLQEELARATRFRAPLSLIFFDMDNLKEVNKRFGHSMGSRTLWEVSSRVRGKIRKFDKLFRFGGDEFCIVLPETEWHGGLEVAERAREAIAGCNFLMPESEDGKGIRMTASFGIASFPLHARTNEELVQRADRAMQQIKNGTKNSIGIAEIAGVPNGA